MLFQPWTAGIDQAGIAQCIQSILSAYSSQQQLDMCKVCDFFLYFFFFFFDFLVLRMSTSLEACRCCPASKSACGTSCCRCVLSSLKLRSDGLRIHCAMRGAVLGQWLLRRNHSRFGLCRVSHMTNRGTTTLWSTPCPIAITAFHSRLAHTCMPFFFTSFLFSTVTTGPN